MQKKMFDEQLAVNTLRVLSAEAITKAKSGHPGIALGAANILYELFVNQMNVCPKFTNYYNRDRFVLSAGHGSSLLYATMLLCGFNHPTMDDLKNFRQINSNTPGHPEPSLLDGVEVSSGPLGQGIAMAVGLAIASKKTAHLLNTAKTRLMNNKVYCLFGDGCFQEGISYEAFAIAGRLKLDNLIMIYDFNGIQLDGKVSDTTEIDIKKYFKALGWETIFTSDNLKNLSKAFAKAKTIKKPVVIVCKTTIGCGCELAGTNKVHGSPLNETQLANLRKTLKYDYPEFTIPEELKQIPDYVNKRVGKEVNKFNLNLQELEKEDIEAYNLAIDFVQKQEGKFDYKWFDRSKFASLEATRNISGQILQTVLKHNPGLIVSIADLSSSTKIIAKDSSFITSKNWGGKNLNCGVREFAMGAINNGISAFGTTKAIGSTFMSFSDYNKAAIRLAAISRIPSINIYSHDSILVGEDGPTHQPIEQLWTLRLIPNHFVFRPYSTIDTIVAFEFAIKSKTTPTSIITSRSAFNQINVPYDLAKKGAYVVYGPKKRHSVTIYATGSEVPLAIEVAKKMKKVTRVVAINSFELLKLQDEKYLNMIFDNSKKVSIEFGCTTPWHKYVDLAIGIDQFGYSGKPSDIIKKLELTPEDILKRIQKQKI